MRVVVLIGFKGGNLCGDRDRLMNCLIKKITQMNNLIQFFSEEWFFYWHLNGVPFYYVRDKTQIVSGPKNLPNLIAANLTILNTFPLSMFLIILYIFLL